MATPLTPGAPLLRLASRSALLLGVAMLAAVLGFGLNVKHAAAGPISSSSCWHCNYNHPGTCSNSTATGGFSACRSASGGKCRLAGTACAINF